MIPTRKTLKNIIALLMLTSVAFLAWMVLQGQSSSSQPPGTPTADSDTDFIVNIPQKALWRNYVTVSVEAIPGTTCELIYISPSGEIQQTDTVANTSGLCAWRWKVDESQGRGAGRLIFTIEGISETHFMEIRSSF